MLEAARRATIARVASTSERWIRCVSRSAIVSRQRLEAISAAPATASVNATGPTRSILPVGSQRAKAIGMPPHARTAAAAAGAMRSRNSRRDIVEAEHTESDAARRQDTSTIRLTTVETTACAASTWTIARARKPSVIALHPS